MKNDYEVRGDETIIFIKWKNKIIETVIETSDLPLVKSITGTWHASWDNSTQSFYIQRNVTVVPGRVKNGGKRTRQPLHRLIMNAKQGMEIDHINHDTLDNRRSYLREVEGHHNDQNRKGAQVDNKTSGIRGVSFHKETQKWRAYITLNRKQIHLGVYNDMYEAERIVKEKRKELMPYSQEALAN